jgi:hypothetical protein
VFSVNQFASSQTRSAPSHGGHQGKMCSFGTFHTAEEAAWEHDLKRLELGHEAEGFYNLRGCRCPRRYSSCSTVAGLGIAAMAPPSPQMVARHHAQTLWSASKHSKKGLAWKNFEADKCLSPPVMGHTGWDRSYAYAIRIRRDSVCHTTYVFQKSHSSKKKVISLDLGPGAHKRLPAGSLGTQHDETRSHQRAFAGSPNSDSATSERLSNSARLIGPSLNSVSGQLLYVPCLRLQANRLQG